MRRALVLSTVLTALSALSGAAVAQQAPTNTAGLRYLSWPGKPPVATRAAPVPAPAVIQAETPAATVVAANRTLPGALPLARLSPAPSAAPSVTTPRGNGLTPASAWMAPQRVPMQAAPAEAAPAQATPVQTEPTPYVPAAAPRSEHQPEPAPAPQPSVQAETQPAPVQAQVEPAQQQPAPVRQAQVEPAPAEPTLAEPAQAQPAQAERDPMAPRRDAPIFRLQRPQAGAPADGSAAAPQQTAQIASTGEQSARYYSVHRQAGRHPDAIPAPQQTYLDALPVQLTQTPQSSDLAQPDGPPALIRNANGSLRAVPQTEADNLP